MMELRTALCKTMQLFDNALREEKEKLTTPMTPKKTRKAMAQ